jgi:hypothetical protein
LFGRGFDIKIIGSENQELATVSLDKGASSNALRNRHWRHSRHFKQLGAQGGKARAEKLTPEQRKAISNKGVRAWKRICAARRQGIAHKAANANGRNYDAT